MQQVFRGFRFPKCKKSFLLLKYVFLGISVSWSIRKVFFWENVRRFLILQLESFIFSEWIFFIYWTSTEKFHFLKYKFSMVCVSWNIKNFLGVSVFRNIRKCKKFPNIRDGKFHFRKCNEFFFGVDFFIFWALAERCTRWLYISLMYGAMNSSINLIDSVEFEYIAGLAFKMWNVLLCLLNIK